jgi:hypothetical protein
VHGLVRQLDASPSTCRWSVEVYVSHGPHQEETVVFGYIEGSFLVSRTSETGAPGTDANLVDLHTELP